MVVSERFDRAARDVGGVPYFLPCRCGQVHFGGRLNRPVVELSCNLCDETVVFNLSHVGALPRADRRLTGHSLPPAVTFIPPEKLTWRKGRDVSGKETWRVGPPEDPVSRSPRLVASMDAQGGLVYVALYNHLGLDRAVTLHQESGFVQYRSDRSCITYERGVVEGPVLSRWPGQPDSVVLVCRRFGQWARRMVRRVIRQPAPRRRRVVERVTV